MRSPTLTACGWIDDAGVGSHRGGRSWKEMGTTPGQMRWRMLSSAPFDRFGRLSCYARYAVAAAEMLGLPSGGQTVKARTGVVLATTAGPASTDEQFYTDVLETGIASPQLFPYTLSSTVVGEVAIRYHLTGPNCSFPGHARPTATALSEAAWLVADGEADACIFLVCDAVSPAAERLTKAIGPARASAMAFLLESVASAEAGGRRPRVDVHVTPDAERAGGTSAGCSDADCRRRLRDLVCRLYPETLTVGNPAGGCIACEVRGPTQAGVTMR